jgi:FemAB-related protein (PEP-CTERM system-associated)
VTSATESIAENSIIVDALTADRCREWDAYVRSARDGLPLHLSGWRQVLHKTYGYETRYLMALSGQQIVGVLPLFLVPSRLTGKRAMTMPGGLCADNDAAAVSLIENGLQTAIADGVDRLLVQDSRQIWPDYWQAESQHVYWLVKLGASEEDLWRGLNGNIRRQVRKAIRNNLEVEVGRDEMFVEPFYDMFSQFTHQAGTPVFSRTFLQNVVDTFPDGYNIALVRHENQPIAGYFQVEMGNTVYGMWGAALSATRKLRPAYLALWEIMRDAVNNGFTNLDMGRSPAEANASKFKGQWGGNSSPVYQTIILSNENEQSNSMTSQVQSDERFQLFMQIWPRLPLSLTRFLGPKLRWHIPFA